MIIVSYRENAEVALRCAEDGIPVVPLHIRESGRCSCGDEHCRHAGRHSCTKNGISDATTDPKQIQRFWKKNPKAKVGIVLGSTANLIALEIDGERGRLELKKLESSNGSLPRTVTIYDYGRRLYLFRFDHSRAIHTKVADGVRLLSDGDLVAMPRPAGAGKKHRFLDGRGYDEIEIAQAPPWLIAYAARLMAERSSITVPADVEVSQPAAAPTPTTGTIIEGRQTGDSAIIQRRRGRPRKSLDSRAAASTKVEPAAPESDPGSILPGASNSDRDHVQLGSAGSRLPPRQKLVLQAILAVYRSAPPSIQAIAKDLMR
jgi:Bifunctional DNA primase/polymerase, N-terminal